MTFCFLSNSATEIRFFLILHLFEYLLWFFDFFKAKILLKFYYLVGTRKLQVMGSITW